MIYLASPYTAHDSAWPDSLQAIRFAQALHATAILTSRGRTVLSPVVLGHTMDIAMRSSGLPRPSYEWWLAWSRELLDVCDTLYVLTVEGWEDSRGVETEILWAKENDIPVIYIDSEGNHLYLRDDE